MTAAYGVVCAACARRIEQSGIEALCCCWSSDGPHFHDPAPIPVDLDGQLLMFWTCAVCSQITNSPKAVRAEPFSFGDEDPRVIIPHGEVDVIVFPPTVRV